MSKLPKPRGYTPAQIAEAQRWNRWAAKQDWSNEPGLFGASMRALAKENRS